MLRADTKVNIKQSDGLHTKGTVYNFNNVGVDITTQSGKRVFMPWFSVIKVTEEKD